MTTHLPVTWYIALAPILLLPWLSLYPVIILLGAVKLARKEE